MRFYDLMPFALLLLFLFALVVGWFWLEIESRLLGWLLRRRREREARPMDSTPFRRLAIRRPR